ncbi:peptidylprolyl isomerase [Paenibacillus sp. WQ 127069]|uniref:Peptidylprolyl isomerase n=1 Tax=Paenibacillus baimaensis TaxID=2982185 RepID=A0ABT2UJS6_9BACL|nr:peptidylprolyl isomerase [Paenibacillus sp. WQ 127069]MCU6794899.1 peptidylprolyl isomerase [Paenibacillus sp. WQ 127069]
MLSIKWNRAKKGLITLATVMTVAAVVAGCGGDKAGTGAAPAPAPTGTPATPAKGDASEVLVTYKDGGKVTRGEFDTFVNINTFFYKEYAQYKEDPAFQQDMMKQLVTFRVLSARADDKAKAEADTKTKQQVEQINTYLGMQEGGMEKQLKDANLNAKDIEQFIGRSMLAISALESKVSEQQVKDAYDKKLAADKNIYDIATVSHILVGTSDAATGKETRTKEEAMKRAKEVQDKLKAGGDFAALALEYSDDPGSKDKGGKYENVELSMWVPEFKKAAAELPINQISDPVETSYGYHIMKVESRKTKTYDEVKESLRSEAAETQVYDFVEKELPTLIETNTLPTPTPPPAAAPAPTAPTAPAAPPAEAPKTEAPAAK